MDQDLKFPKKTGYGFSLIEMMVVVAILGILSAIALPAYQKYVQKSRRADAAAAVTAVMQAQERYRTNNASYTDSLATLKTDAGLIEPIASGESSDGYYRIELSGASGSGYTATATAVGKQASDDDCSSMGVLLSGGQTVYQKKGDADSSNLCWSH